VRLLAALAPTIENPRYARRHGGLGLSTPQGTRVSHYARITPVFFTTFLYHAVV